MTQIQFDENTARCITAGVRFGKVRTTLGLDARIVCWNAKGDFPIVALIKQADGSEVSIQYTIEGKADARNNIRTSFDLILEVDGGEI